VDVVSAPKSAGFMASSVKVHATGEVTDKPLKYWALLQAIRMVLLYAPYPEVMDALMEPMHDMPKALDGKRTGRPRKDAG
jgi:hypothetical protein